MSAVHLIGKLHGSFTNSSSHTIGSPGEVVLCRLSRPWPFSCVNPRLEWEQLLEEHRTLQDSFDQLQAEAKFEADEVRQQLEDRQQELAAQQALITVSDVIKFSCYLYIPPDFGCVYFKS